MLDARASLMLGFTLISDLGRRDDGDAIWKFEESSAWWIWDWEEEEEPIDDDDDALEDEEDDGREDWEEERGPMDVYCIW